MWQKLINKGFYYAKKGDLIKALRIFEFVIKTKEYTPEVLHASGVILLYFGEFKKALKILKLNIKNDGYKPSSEILDKIEEIKKYSKDFNLAIEEFKGGSYKNVINLLGEYEQKEFLTYDGQKLLAIAYYKQKRIDECIRLLREMDDIYPYNDFTKGVYDELNKHYYRIKRNYKIAASCLALALLFSTLFLKDFMFMGKEVKEVKETQTKHVYHVNDNFYELLRNYLSGNYYEFEKIKRQMDLRTLNEKEIMVYNLVQKEYERIDSSYFYKQGLKLFRDKDYKKSAEYFEIANSMHNENYLKEHILFFLASSYKYFEKEKAIRYYNEYVNKYINGCYRAEALYTLALMAWDDTSAYKYALQIEKEYKNTMYYNSKIKKILEKRN